MERKEFLELMIMSIRVNLVMTENEDEKTLSVVHGAIIETFMINEHLDITNVEDTMKDEAIQYIIDRTDEEIVHDLLEITKRLYIEQFFEEERECEYLI